MTIQEIREHHARIKKLEREHLDFNTRISRNALLDYVEGVDVLLSHIDALGEVSNKHAGSLFSEWQLQNAEETAALLEEAISVLKHCIESTGGYTGGQAQAFLDKIGEKYE